MNAYRLRPLWLLPLVVAGALLLVSCGGDDDGDVDADGTTVENTPAASSEGNASPSSAPAGDLTSAQICDLVSVADAGKALGAEVSAATPVSGGTPGCSYAFRSGNVSNTAILAVMRSTDVNGLKAKAAFDYAVEQNRRLAAGAPEEKVSGIGENALFMAGSALNIMIVQDGDRVLTIAGRGLSKDACSALMKQVVQKV